MPEYKYECGCKVIVEGNHIALYRDGEHVVSSTPETDLYYGKYGPSVEETADLFHRFFCPMPF